MRIRPINPSDMNEIRKIHSKYYNYDLPEDHYLCSFIVEDENGKMITAGGIRTIAEIIAVTDKEISPRIRREALMMLLRASNLVCNNNGYNQFHAFVTDEKWYNQLLRHGFNITNGKALIYG